MVRTLTMQKKLLELAEPDGSTNRVFNLEPTDGGRIDPALKFYHFLLLNLNIF
jgi:hypothetical protein